MVSNHELKKRLKPAQKQSLDLISRERELILQALEQCYWNQTKAARQLGITRNTLRYRMKKFGIKRE